MICRLCLNTLDEQNAVLLFGAVDNDKNKTMPENYLVQLISTHLYLCLSRDDAISTCICMDCCAQLESFHNFWKLVELKQTTLCSQFLEIDCDVNWSEEGDVELTAIEEEPEADETPPVGYEDFVKDETEVPESFSKADAKVAPHKFPCMFCEKSFKMRRYLEEHIATHTGDRPIACSYCEMAFRCRSNMYTHVKTKHTAQWLKARADRELAKVNTNNNIQSTANGEKPPCAYVEAEAAKQSAMPPTQIAACVEVLVKAEPAAEQLPLPPVQLSPVKSEPVMEAINLTVAKTTATSKRVTRSSRRKTHSPKKVQHAECSASDDSNADDAATQSKRLKTELQTCKENELMLANYNAVAAAVAASLTTTAATESLQQRWCASIMQQQELLTVMAAASGSTATTSVAVPPPPPPTTPPAQCSTPAKLDAKLDGKLDAETASSSSYTCSICGQHLRNQRALNNHLHNKHNALQPTPNLELAACANCGELPGQKHRCLSKAKYACDVCGKCFKMKRYLEEHFATHTGVKLHTCAFCPTEFRSKSNMYHHTKRKHKLEWERSRATRNAAKGGPQEQQLEAAATATAATATDGAAA